VLLVVLVGVLGVLGVEAEDEGQAKF